MVSLNDLGAYNIGLAEWFCEGTILVALLKPAPKAGFSLFKPRSAKHKRDAGACFGGRNDHTGKSRYKGKARARHKEINVDD